MQAKEESAVDILSGASGNVWTQKLLRIGKGGDKPLAVHILSGTSCKCMSLKTGKNRQGTGDKPSGVHIILSSCSSSGMNSFNCCCVILWSGAGFVSHYFGCFHIEKKTHKKDPSLWSCPQVSLVSSPSNAASVPLASCFSNMYSLISFLFS